MKILTIIGARPQFIKAGSLSREILLKRKEGLDITEVLVHTGQHYDVNMSDIFFEQMHIPKPNYFLGIGGNSHGAMTGRMIEKIEEILLKENPDWVVVYGDTNSTLAGTIAASKLKIKIAHVEAGLRSFNMNMPEEINRILADRLSTILFCPTTIALNNLKSEAFPYITNEGKKQVIINVGDIMLDGALFYKNFSLKPSIFNDSQKNIKNFILCTIHRAENTDDVNRLTTIIDSLNEIAKERQIILPIHPRTKKILEQLSLDTSGLIVIDPVGYLEMIWLLDKCDFVITDSGGLQKEAYFFEKPCITLRDETEWVELLECGANTLVGASKERILNAFQSISDFNKKIFKLNLYGEGGTSNRILNSLINQSI
jgi:UDP-GlcNAc3NAcA epimerase